MSRLLLIAVLSFLIVGPAVSDTSIADPQTRKTWARLADFKERVKDLRLEAVRLRKVILAKNGGQETTETAELSKHSKKLLAIYREVPTHGSKRTQDNYVLNRSQSNRKSFNTISARVSKYQSRYGSGSTAKSDSKSGSSSSSSGKGYNLEVSGFDSKELEVFINGKKIKSGSNVGLPSNKTLKVKLVYLSAPRKIGRRGNTKTVIMETSTNDEVVYRSNTINASTRMVLVEDDYRWKLRDMDSNWQFNPSNNVATIKTDGNGKLEVELRCKSSWEKTSVRNGKERGPTPVGFDMPSQTLRLIVTPRI